MRVERSNKILHITFDIDTTKLKDWNPAHQELRKVAALSPVEVNELQDHIVGWFNGQRLKSSGDGLARMPAPATSCENCAGGWAEQEDGSVIECKHGAA